MVCFLRWVRKLRPGAWLSLLTVVCFLSLTGTGCSSKDDADSSDFWFPFFQFHTVMPKAEVLDIIKRGRFQCSQSFSGNICPPSGLVMIMAMSHVSDITHWNNPSLQKDIREKDQYVLSECSGFLIADDIVATNSHCIPDSVKRDHNHCDGHVFGILSPVEGSTSEEVVECSELITASNIDDNAPTAGRDYAFFRLKKKANRQAFSVNYSGIPSDEGMIAQTVNFERGSGEAIGTYIPKKCKTLQDTILLPEYNHNQSPLFAVGICDIIPGNSGSPLTNSEGTVASGILQATLNDPAKNILQPMMSVNPGPLAFGTNFACIDPPVGAPSRGALPEGCDRTFAAVKISSELMNLPILERQQDRANLMLEMTLVALDSRMEKEYPAVEWEFEPHPEARLGRIYHLIPKCVKTSIEEDQGFEVNAFEFKKVINSEYRMDYEIKSTGEKVLKASELELSPCQNGQ